MLRTEECAENMAELKNGVSFIQKMINCCGYLPSVFLYSCCEQCCHFQELDCKVIDGNDVHIGTIRYVTGTYVT